MTNRPGFSQSRAVNLLQLVFVVILVTQLELEGIFQPCNIVRVDVEWLLFNQEVYNITEDGLEIIVVCRPAGVVIDPQNFIFGLLRHLQIGGVVQQVQESNLLVTRIFQKLCRFSRKPDLSVPELLPLGILA